MPEATVRRWASHGSVPGHFGTWSISAGLGVAVVVEVTGAQVTVRLRPRFIARLLGVAPLVAEPGSGLAVTARGAGWPYGWLMDFQLLDFQLPGGRCYSLQTNKKDEVLSSLAEAGFDVPVAEGR